MVVIVGVNTFPVPSAIPPVAFAYQLIVPFDAVADKVTVPGPQFEPATVFIIVGIVLIVAITSTLTGVVQVPSLASTK